MAELLVVVDSEAKALFMKEYYSDRAACVICTGPLFATSHQPSAGSPTELLFQFEGLPSGQQTLDALRDFQDKEILLALDDNAFANYLSWQISRYVTQVGGRAGAVKRLSVQAFCHENMTASLRVAWPLEAMSGLSFYSGQLFDDCLAHHLDRLIGTDHGPGNLPLRKNSLTTLFLLAEREHDQAPLPVLPKWQLQVSLAATVNEPSFTAYLSTGMDLAADGLISNEAKARSLKNQFWQMQFLADTQSRSPMLIAAPEPYRLAELLHDALLLLDLDLLPAMGIIRKLFHGVPVDGRTSGLISSPVRHQRGLNRAQEPGPETLPQEMIHALRQQVVTLYGEVSLAEGSPLTAGVIIPVRAELSSADLAEGLSQAEAALYELIRQRALASQMHPAVGDTITIDFLAGKENIFQAHFQELSNPGFLQTAPLELAKFQPPIPLEAITAGQIFRPLKVECEPLSKGGQGPESYTIKTLFDALAEFSIDPDLSAITMLDSLIQLGYATLSKQGHLKAAENTIKVVSILDRAFPRMQGINLAAYLEQTINEAVSARKGLPFALKQFDQTLMLHGKTLVKAKITATKVQPRTRTSSTIIKQTLASAEVISPTPAREEDAAGPTSQTLPTPTSPQILPVQPPTPAEPKPSQEQPAIASPSREDLTAPRLSEGWTDHPPAGVAPESEIKEAASRIKAAPGSVLPEEEAEDLPDDLHKVFADAWEGAASSADITETATSLAPDGVPITEEGSATGQNRTCPACGKAMCLQEDRFGTFWKCAGFPACRYSEATNVPAADLICPLCRHGLTMKQTPTGKNFYVCGYQDCSFMSWSIPHHLPCGLCDSPYLVEKTVLGVPQLRCPRAGCPYGQPRSEENQETSPAAMVKATKKVLVRRVTPGTASGGGTRTVKIVRRRP